MNITKHDGTPISDSDKDDIRGVLAGMGISRGSIEEFIERIDDPEAYAQLGDYIEHPFFGREGRIIVSINPYTGTVREVSGFLTLREDHDPWVVAGQRIGQFLGC